MRITKRHLVATIALLVLLPGLSWGQSRDTENTLRLDDGAARPAAKIGDVAWMAGYWRGPGLGGVSEEIWSQPSDGRMHGIYTLSKEEGLVFWEAMTLVEEEGSLVLKVKHFTPEFVGWEEKEDNVAFPLVRLGENEAWFRGLTFRRTSDRELLIHIALSQGGERSEHEIRLERVEF